MKLAATTNIVAMTEAQEYLFESVMAHSAHFQAKGFSDLNQDVCSTTATPLDLAGILHDQRLDVGEQYTWPRGCTNQYASPTTIARSLSTKRRTYAIILFETGHKTTISPMPSMTHIALTPTKTIAIMRPEGPVVRKIWPVVANIVTPMMPDIKIICSNCQQNRDVSHVKLAEPTKICHDVNSRLHPSVTLFRNRCGHTLANGPSR